MATSVSANITLYPNSNIFKTTSFFLFVIILNCGLLNSDDDVST